MPNLTPTEIKTYAVHDHWTDINKKNDVDIISIDGEITRIKVNGEDYGGGGGSSDFSIANMTIQVVGDGNRIAFQDFLTIEEEEGRRIFNTKHEFDAIADDGEMTYQIPILDGGYSVNIVDLVGTVSIEGAGRYFTDHILCIGDCTITITGGNNE